MSTQAWLSTSLVRHYPASPAQNRKALSLDLALNERFSFQVALRQSDQHSLPVRVQVTAPSGWKVRVRRVGYVPMRHLNTPVDSKPEDQEGRDYLPGWVPDPLFDEDTGVLPCEETHAFWVSVVPAAKATPGKHPIAIEAIPEKGRPSRLRVTASLADVRIPKRRNFSVTNWFYIDTLMSWYKTSLSEDRFWEILPTYMKNIVAHGQDTIYTSVFSVQLDGDRIPSQLLHVTKTGKDQYAFDWRYVKQFVDLAKKAGVKNFEWSHFFSQWGVARALKVYEGLGEDGTLLWPAETPACSPVYRRFMEQFLPELHSFLKQEKLLKRSFFHVSDEPHTEHIENYANARAMLKDLAPWMKVMDALTNVEFAEEGLTDMPVPSITGAVNFHNKGIECWCYFCCGPRGPFLNRLFDTPLAKIRMSGWLFYRWPFKGFLHWGYNYWNLCQKSQLIDPFMVGDANSWPGWAFGDTFLVYPGENGPIDSIRWEVFGESLQDYALLQGAGIARDDAILSELKGFADFPKTEAWLKRARRKVLSSK